MVTQLGCYQVSGLNDPVSEDTVTEDTETEDTETEDTETEDTEKTETSELNGDASIRNPDEMGDPCEDLECGPGTVPGSECGACPGATDWCNAGTCEDDCAGLQCGPSPNQGHNCGTCSEPTPFCVGNTCSSESPVEFVAITGGTFEMGSTELEFSEEQPVHEVTMPSFEMTKTEVTVAQYALCVNHSGTCTAPDTGKYCNWGETGYEDHPVSCVDWDQAVAFCTWVGGRLPSEAEWEHAASNGSAENTYPWGEATPTCDYAVMYEGGAGCGTERTWPVCSKTAGNTSHGLCDMAGNVYEWVQDCYHSSYTGAPTDGSAWEESGFARVLRGGSWGVDNPDYLRSSFRDGIAPVRRNDLVGFRCARSSR